MLTLTQKFLRLWIQLCIFLMCSELHPTPAVGGQPREQAVPRIKMEGFEEFIFRADWWFNDQNEGKMVVGIRSAQFDDKQLGYTGRRNCIGVSSKMKKKRYFLNSLQC